MQSIQTQIFQLNKKIAEFKKQTPGFSSTIQGPPSPQDLERLQAMKDEMDVLEVRSKFTK